MTEKFTTSGKGIFITLEGCEGTGKTTAIKHLTEFLENKGRICVWTREPGGSKWGQKLRYYILNPNQAEVSHFVELAIYIIDRILHVYTFIKPALRRGEIVLCDRHKDSTIVYQGYGRGINIFLLKLIHFLVLGRFNPDVTFLFDLPPEIGLERAWKQLDFGERGDEESRFEREMITFHKKIRLGYLVEAKKEPKRWVVVDVEKNDEFETAKIICDELQKRFF